MLYGLYLVCFQQVYAQLPAVYLQHPFWGDVSSFSRCEAAFHPSAAAKQRFSKPKPNLIRLGVAHQSGPLFNRGLTIQELAKPY